MEKPGEYLGLILTSFRVPDGELIHASIIPDGTLKFPFISEIPEVH